MVLWPLVLVLLPYEFWPGREKLFAGLRAEVRLLVWLLWSSPPKVAMLGSGCCDGSRGGGSFWRASRSCSCLSCSCCARSLLLFRSIVRPPSVDTFRDVEV